jgi:hypothetical protein
MLRKSLSIMAVFSLIAAASIHAQSPFEKIHGDVLGKMELARARRAPGLGPFLAPQPRPNQLLYDVVHYTIDVAINPNARIVEGSVKIGRAHV